MLFARWAGNRVDAVRLAMLPGRSTDVTTDGGVAVEIDRAWGTGAFRALSELLGNSSAASAAALVPCPWSCGRPRERFLDGEISTSKGRVGEAVGNNRYDRIGGGLLLCIREPSMIEREGGQA